MSIKSNPPCDIRNMTTEALDVEELEHRLELAGAVACCDCCGNHATGCEQLTCAVDPAVIATPNVEC